MKFKCEHFVKLTRLRVNVLVLAIAGASLQACAGALAGGTVNNPFHQEEPVTPTPPSTPAPSDPPRPYDGHVRQFGAWLDSKAETAAVTTFVTYWIGCDEDPLAVAGQIDPLETRQIVWFANLFNYGPTARSRNGYGLRADASACWQTLKTLIANHRDRTLAVWLLDEPDSVAWGDMVPGGPYDPNLYSADITTACAMVHADFPTLDVAVNYGGVPADLRVPSCLSLVGLESYGVDWAAQLRNLETKTSAPIWLLAPAFVDGDPVAQDPLIAARFAAEYDHARRDPRVTGFYPFLWCCDDITTGAMHFYTVSGPQLPMTRAAFESIGRAIRGTP